MIQQYWRRKIAQQNLTCQQPNEDRPRGEARGENAYWCVALLPGLLAHLRFLAALTGHMSNAVFRQSRAYQLVESVLGSVVDSSGETHLAQISLRQSQLTAPEPVPDDFCSRCTRCVEPCLGGRPDRRVHLGDGV